MINVARENFILSDSSKFAAKATHVAVSINQMDHLITDTSAKAEVVKAFKSFCKVHGTTN